MNFDQRCYEKLKSIPEGKVTTYKSIALALGSKAYRAVGNAMKKNPYGYSAFGRAGASPQADKLLPCHRVVKSDGSVGSYAGGTKKKIALLRAEGVVIENGKVDLSDFGYRF